MAKAEVINLIHLSIFIGRWPGYYEDAKCSVYKTLGTPFELIINTLKYTNELIPVFPMRTF